MRRFFSIRRDDLSITISLLDKEGEWTHGLILGLGFIALEDREDIKYELGVTFQGRALDSYIPITWIDKITGRFAAKHDYNIRNRKLQ